MIFNFLRIFEGLGFLFQKAIQGEDPLSEEQTFPLSNYAVYVVLVMIIAFVFYITAMSYTFFAYREFKALLYEQQATGAMGNAGSGVQNAASFPPPASQRIYIYIYIY